MLSLPDFKEKTIVMVFALQGQKFSFLNDNLIVKDAEDKIILQTTCYRMLALWIVGNCTITSGLLERSKKFAFPVLLLSSNFRCIGSWNAPTEGNFLLRKKQYDYEDWSLAKHIISNKILNQIGLLKSIRVKGDALWNAIISLDLYRNGLSEAKDLKTILGIEGISSRLYFSYWFDNIDWQGRQPRTKRDPVNSVLDMGYTFLFYLVENMLHLYGFDLYQGVYHRNFYKRKSLVCDIQEPFRCIVDKQVKKAFSLNQIKEEDFEIKNGQCLLKLQFNKEYTKWMLKSIIEYKAEVFIYCQKYYRSFIQQKAVEDYPTFLINE